MFCKFNYNGYFNLSFSVKHFLNFNFLIIKIQVNKAAYERVHCVTAVWEGKYKFDSWRSVSLKDFVTEPDLGTFHSPRARWPMQPSNSPTPLKSLPTSPSKLNQNHLDISKNFQHLNSLIPYQHFPLPKAPSKAKPKKKSTATMPPAYVTQSGNTGFHKKLQC